jgi:hypothetical protein
MDLFCYCHKKRSAYFPHHNFGRYNKEESTMQNTITRYMYTKQITLNKSNRKDAKTNKQYNRKSR